LFHVLGQVCKSLLVLRLNVLKDHTHRAGGHGSIKKKIKVAVTSVGKGENGRLQSFFMMPGEGLQDFNVNAQTL